MSRYFRLLLDDYSAASFTSFDKDYYGRLSEIQGLFEAMKEDEETAKHHEYELSIFERYLAGEKKISHTVAYREVPFLVPAKVLWIETSVLSNHSWEHINTWQCPYYMKFDRAESTHIWFSCYGKYNRCIQTKFTNLQYQNTHCQYTPLGDMMLGYPCQIDGERGNLFNRLFVEEKIFKTKAATLTDHQEFISNPDPIYDKILDDIFGDG